VPTLTHHREPATLHRRHPPDLRWTGNSGTGVGELFVPATAREESRTVVPTVTLNNGVEIPQLGFGVFQVDPEQTRQTTLAALQAGYRHVDTAEMYRNEAEVGQAVRASWVDLDDVFIASKLSNRYHAHDEAMQAFDRSLAE
jgi:Aldo/keto reductase family